MGHIQIADAMTTKATEMLDKVYQSNFTQFLQGLGTPVTGTWYNVNDTLSTATGEMGTVDDIIGPNSPIRYNKITNYPVYGLNSDLVPNLETGEGGLFDLEMEVEVTILPNNIRPTPYDHYLYTFQTAKGTPRSVLFRINNITMQAIRGNSYYKVTMHMIDIDSNYQLNQLNQQVVKTFDTNLELIGSNEKCLVEETTSNLISLASVAFSNLLSDYIDFFYNDKFNCILFNGWLKGGFSVYDPYLTNFIISTALFEKFDPVITMVVFDPEDNFRANYNKTFFRAIQTRDKNDINRFLRYQPLTFRTTNTTPFAYWGINTVFKLNVYEDKCPCNPTVSTQYMNYDWFKNIFNGREPIGQSVIEMIIVRYFNTENLSQLITETELEWLKNYRTKYNERDYLLIPIILYLLQVFISNIL